MRIENAFVGARLIDSVAFSQGGTAAQAQALKSRGVDGVCGYLGSINSARLGYILDAGLGFIPVTYAGEYFDGATDETVALRVLGIPTAATVFLDLEGEKSFNWNAQDLIRLINVWSKSIVDSGYIAGLYIGSPQPLTGDELGRLPYMTRYWSAPSRLLDRNGKAWDEPTGCGWCMRQQWPSIIWQDTGVFVDANMVGQDRKGRVPTWVKA